MNKLPATSRRVEERTSARSNQRIHRRTKRNIDSCKYADRGEINRRLLELDYEWDTERVLETGAGLLMLHSSLMALAGRKKCLLLGAAVGGSLLMHALQGWCPPLPLIRCLGVRTAQEINEEKIALRQIRGDFAAQPYNQY